MADVSLTSEPIDPSKVISSVMRKECGGIVVFIGAIRDSSGGKPVKRVEVEAYGEMAVKDMQAIIDRARKKHPVAAATIVHRTGRLFPGDIVVVIAVSAPHRREAFDACGEIIDAMKKTTPIWKEELMDGGGKWVEGESG
jgi:molybdopterin synthase catalytic subunit